MWLSGQTVESWLQEVGMEGRPRESGLGWKVGHAKEERRGRGVPCYPSMPCALIIML